MTKQEYMDALKEALAEFDAEIRDEIVEDYEEHFNIGLASGKSEEAIAEELGSIEELVAELNELKGNGTKGFDWKKYKDKFHINSEDVVKTLNDVAFSVAGFLGTVAATIANGTEKVVDATTDGAETFAQAAENVSGKIVSKTEELVKEATASYRSARGEAAEPVESDEEAENPTSFTFADFEKVVIDTDCGDIIVTDSVDDKIHVDYQNNGTANQQLAYKLFCEQKGNALHVSVKKQIGTTTFFRTLEAPDIVLNVELPANLKKVKIQTVSGDVIAKDISATEVSALSVSGDVALKAVKAEMLIADSVSGDLRIDGVNVKTANLKDISGDVTFNGAGLQKLVATSISGDVNIKLDFSTGYSATVSTTSGGMNIKYAESAMLGVKNGTYDQGDALTKINVSTISGSITVEA